MKITYLLSLLLAFTALQASAQPATSPVVFEVSGLVSSSPPGDPAFVVSLLNNGVNPITVVADGTFSFSTELPTGDAYNVTVDFQPDFQTCTVANPSGTAGGIGPIPLVTCVGTPPATTTPTAVPVMPLWLLGLLSILLVGISSRRLRKA